MPMQIRAVSPLTVQFVGPEGHYSLQFQPSKDGWDGAVEVTIAGNTMLWSVERIERDDQNRLVLSGMTATKDLWKDSFWFEAIVEPQPGQITYWGNQVVWRTDNGA